MVQLIGDETGAVAAFAVPGKRQRVGRNPARENIAQIRVDDRPAGKRAGNLAADQIHIRKIVLRAQRPPLPARGIGPLQTVIHRPEEGLPMPRQDESAERPVHVLLKILGRLLSILQRRPKRRKIVASLSLQTEEQRALPADGRAPGVDLPQERLRILGKVHPLIELVNGIQPRVVYQKLIHERTSSKMP